MIAYLFLILVLSLIPFGMSFAQEDGSYELDEALCLGGPGMEFDENCHRIHLSPYAQQRSGIESKDVRCNHDLYRNYKTFDGTAFCASGYSLKPLIHRGYAEPFDTFVSHCTTGEGKSVTIVQYLEIKTVDGKDYFVSWHTSADSETGVACEYPQLIQHSLGHDFGL